MRAQRLAVRLSHAIGLPEDVVLGLPRLLLTGDRELSIENHRGVRSMTPERISIDTRCGTVVIDGQALVLRTIAHDDVAIAGSIAGIAFVRDDAS